MSLMSNHGMQSRSARGLFARNGSSLRSLAVGVAVAMLSACGGDDPISVSSVSVSPASVSVALGASTQLAAATLDGNGTVITGRPVTWSTANASIATVSGGRVTGVAPGAVTITATSEGQTGSAAITVLPPTVATVTISPVNPTISEVDTLRLSAVLRAADGSVLTGRPITWASATPANATISNSGLVSGVQPGTSVITATSEGKSATATVTITISQCNASLAKPIVAGTLVNGTLASGDCPWEDDTFADIYRFALTSTTTVEVLLRSTAFNAYVYVYSPNLQGDIVPVAANDNGGGGTDARLFGSLNAGTHFIVANSFSTATGAYTLLLTAPFAALTADPFSIRAATDPAIKLERATPAETRALRALVRRRSR